MKEINKSMIKDFKIGTILELKTTRTKIIVLGSISSDCSVTLFDFASGSFIILKPDIICEKYGLADDDYIYDFKTTYSPAVDGGTQFIKAAVALINENPVMYEKIIKSSSTMEMNERLGYLNMKSNSENMYRDTRTNKGYTLIDVIRTGGSLIFKIERYGKVQCGMTNGLLDHEIIHVNESDFKEHFILLKSIPIPKERVDIYNDEEKERLKKLFETPMPTPSDEVKPKEIKKLDINEIFNLISFDQSLNLERFNNDENMIFDKEYGPYLTKKMLDELIENEDIKIESQFGVGEGLTPGETYFMKGNLNSFPVTIVSIHDDENYLSIIKFKTENNCMYDAPLTAFYIGMLSVRKSFDVMTTDKSNDEFMRYCPVSEISKNLEISETSKAYDDDYNEITFNTKEEYEKIINETCPFDNTPIFLPKYGSYLQMRETKILDDKIIDKSNFVIGKIIVYKRKFVLTIVDILDNGDIILIGNIFKPDAEKYFVKLTQEEIRETELLPGFNLYYYLKYISNGIFDIY